MKFCGGDIIAAGGVGFTCANAAGSKSVYPYAADSQLHGVLHPLSSISVNAVAISPDRSVLIAGRSSAPLLVRADVETEAVLGAPSVMPTGAPNDIVFSPSGNLFAVAHPTSPFVSIYDAATLNKIANPSVLPGGTGNGVAFNSAGTILAVAGMSPAITLYNTGDWSVISGPGASFGSVASGIDFNASGSLMAACSSQAPYLRVYNTGDWSEISISGPGGNTAYKVKFSPGGALLAVTINVAPYYAVYSTTTWEKISGLPDIGGGNQGAGWVSDTHLALIGTRNIMVVDVVNRVIVGSVAHTRNNPNWLFTVPGELRVLSGTVRDINENGLARKVRAIHADTGIVHAKTASEPVTGVFEMTVYNADEYNVVCDGGPGELSESIDAVGV